MDRPGSFGPQLKATIHRPDASTWHWAHIPWAHCGTSKSPRNYTRTVALSHTRLRQKPLVERERERESLDDGVVRECAVVRSWRHSGGGHGAAGGVPGEARIRAGVAWSHQVLPHHSRPPPPHVRGRLAQILRWRSPPCLVHQALPRMSRFISLSMPLIF